MQEPGRVLPAGQVWKLAACPRTFPDCRAGRLVLSTAVSVDPFRCTVWADICSDPPQLFTTTLDFDSSLEDVLVHFGLGGRSLLVFIDGALAGSSPALRDGCVVTICQQASECLTEPLASLFPAFPALRLLQFQVPLPTCISVLARARRAAAHFAVPIAVSSFRREFLFRMAAEAQTMQAAVELGQHSARLAFCCPAFRVCHFSAGFPTARQLRPFLRETWPLLDNHLIADTGEFFGDSTFYALTHPSCPLTAWLRAGHEGEDVLFLPIDVRPTDGIPCPPGFHAHVFRHEGAWGFMQFGRALLERLALGLSCRGLSRS